MLDKSDLRNRRILVIDDNRRIHVDFRKIFQSTQPTDTAMAETELVLFSKAPVIETGPMFEVDSAYQGQEGLALVQQALREQRPYAMAFVDVRMPPGWDGIVTIARIWQEYPDLQVVICTAYSDYSLNDILLELGQSDRLVILKKPFDNIEVLQLSHTLTEKWRLLQQAKAKAGELQQRVEERTQELQAANERLQTEMAERTRVEEALRQAQKMEAIGQLAGGIAHDFNNLLTIISGYTGCLLKDVSLAPQAHENLKQVDDAAQRAANLTRQLLNFSRKQVMQPQCLDLNEVVSQVAKMLHRILGEDYVLRIEVAEAPLVIHADRAMIEQVILNLAVNARDAMRKGGQLLLRTAPAEFTEDDARANPKARPGHFASLIVTDTGCGIPPDIMPRLFEPFFTTKDVGKGTGLGLATAYGITKQHDGWIGVESELGEGTTFRVFLPTQVGSTHSVEEPSSSMTPTGGTETILVVEDEPALRALAQEVLQYYGYQIYTACSGVDALKVWPDHAAKIDLLLTDMIMPDGMTGSELAKRLRADKSTLRVIYSSGYSMELVGRDGVLQEGLNFLPKPYTPQKLANLVRTCLNEPVGPTAEPI